MPREPSILPVGTKIVSRRPLAGVQHVYPRGTVAEVVQQPVDAAHSYRVRLNDGYETALAREEFLLLRTVQEDGLQGADAPALVDRGLERWVIYRCIVGSRAYGLDGEGSDTDTRGIYLPPAERHWSLYGVPDQLENAETDEVYWEVQKFVVLALKANPNILEVLHSPIVIDETDLARELRAMRGAFVSRLLFQTYNGYVLSQFKKMTRRREAERPPKWKHAMHLIRLLLAGIEALREGVVPVRVTEGLAPRLLEIKGGAWTFEEVDRWRCQLHDEFEAEFRRTSLPDRPDYEAANSFLLRARRAALEMTP